MRDRLKTKLVFKLPVKNLGGQSTSEKLIYVSVYIDHQV